jgi:hypothetical protein
MPTKPSRTAKKTAAIREISPAEAREIYQNLNYSKYGVVAACRTTPKGFRAYLERRAAEDLRAKHGK